MPTQTISEARLAANRANAQKSTGPRTPEGKGAVANNAYKHGLRSERNPLDLATETTLPHEHEEFLATLEAFKEDLQPQGTLETRLVERLAHIDLRLTRAARMEMTHLDISAARVYKVSANALPDEDPARFNWLTTLAFLHTPNALELIGRYESRLTRDFAKTLTQLRQSQKLRKQTHPSETTTMSTRSLASNGQIAPAPQPHVSHHVAPKEPHPAQPNIPAEQTQTPLPAMPSQSHVSHDVGINHAASAPEIVAKQTQNSAPPHLTEQPNPAQPAIKEAA